MAVHKRGSQTQALKCKISGAKCMHEPWRWLKRNRSILTG